MDFKALGTQAAESETVAPTRYKGRVLQFDADFAAYQCAHIDETVQENFTACKRMLEIKRKLAGAEFINVHLTLGLKGGRDQIATAKPYQEQRKSNRDPAIKDRVLALRTLMGNYRTENTTPVVNLLQEADDSLAQYQTRQILVGGVDSSVIMSGDKDLWMVDGLHCDPDSGRMYRVEGYGKVEYREVGNLKPKLVGEGKSWFWYQLIQGDTADNIPGLPMLSGRLADLYIPLKNKQKTPRKALKCGEAKAYAMLKDVTNEKEAARRVYEAYTDWYGNADALPMLFEQAFLLWMRTTGDVLDVLPYLKSVGLPYKPNKQQREGLARFKELAKMQIERME